MLKNNLVLLSSTSQIAGKVLADDVLLLFLKAAAYSASSMELAFVSYIEFRNLPDTLNKTISCVHLR